MRLRTVEGVLAWGALLLFVSAQAITLQPGSALQGFGGELEMATWQMEKKKDTNKSTPVSICMSPPCPEDGGLTLKPISGPNHNQQQGTQVVTITGSLFPSDCSPACFMTPPCEVCEMEVTYYVYFGTEDAGCNFYDTAAAACQCNPMSGQDLVQECDWEGVSFASKYRCKQLVCQVSPLYGKQPLKIFFKEKKCTDCDIFPALKDGRIDPKAQLWDLNFTYADPAVTRTEPALLPSSGGQITVVGESFGGDSNFIQVRIDGKPQGVASNPKMVPHSPSKELAMLVQVGAHEPGVHVLEVYVGQGDEGALSPPLKVTFQDDSHRLRLLTALAAVGMVLGLVVLVLLGAWRLKHGPLPNRQRNSNNNNTLRRRLLGEGSGEGGVDGSLNFRIDPAHLTLTNKLARGAFGSVYRGAWLGTVCAVKQIDVWSLQDLKEFSDEASLLSQLHHPNIVQLLGICDSVSGRGQREMLIVMEYMDKGSLAEVLQDKTLELTPAHRVKMGLQAAQGMLYLHSLAPPVLHRDLKSPNLLVDSNLRIKIADFGLSRFRVEYTMTFCGSPKWTAPEVLNGEAYDTPADVWSYGVVLWELLTRKIPYTEGTWRYPRGRGGEQGGEELGGGESSRDSGPNTKRGGAFELQGSQVAVKVAREGSLLVMPSDREAPVELVSLAKRCLTFNPGQRPSFKDLTLALSAGHARLAGEEAEGEGGRASGGEAGGQGAGGGTLRPPGEALALADADSQSELEQGLGNPRPAAGPPAAATGKGHSLSA